MKNLFFAVGLVVILSGCSTFTPPRYSIDADNTVALRKIEVGNINVGDISDPEMFHSGCRGAGAIAPPDGVTFGQYIQEALADELKIAELYNAESPRITLSGQIDSLHFSSSKGLTNGVWDIALTLNSSNGETMSINEHHEFKSGWIADTACKQTAEAFMATVQNMITKIVTSSQFNELIK